MIVNYEKNYVSFRNTDCDDNTLTEMADWLYIFMRELIKQKRFEAHDSKRLYFGNIDEYFKVHSLNRLNSRFGGSDVGIIEIYNIECAVAFMEHFSVGNPVYYRLMYCDNETSAE